MSNDLRCPDCGAYYDDGYGRQHLLSGWRYIRQSHGELYGVGWDRADDKAVKALALYGIDAGNGRDFRLATPPEPQGELAPGEGG